jgi:hypothetical protein
MGSIGRHIVRAFVSSASAVARVNQRVAQIARSVWHIALAVPLLARLRRPLRGGGDPVVDELDGPTVRHRVPALLDNGILPGIRASEISGRKRQAQHECTSAAPASALLRSLDAGGGAPGSRMRSA